MLKKNPDTMPKNFGTNTFLGEVYLPSITTDKLLGIGQLGVVEGVDPIIQPLSLSKITKNFSVEVLLDPDEIILTSIAIAKIYQLLKFQCSSHIRFRIYNSQANQQLDMNRQVTTLFAFPPSDSGLIFERITTPESPLINICPILTGYNLDDSSTSYITITNLSSDRISTLDFQLIYLLLES